ncbi:MAG: tRNA pseudouridine(38-40) synthase TruA [Eubacterium sp.]|nr:tRNA pseudouridine(38-40) synthase TruA [Eubacterium sp.]
MYNYKITVAYDGTRYKGWQAQKSTDATIQAKLESILRRRFGYPVDIIGSGRTDAGVHAKGQVANFHLRDAYGEEELFELFRAYLPEDIAVCSVEEVEERFHSRFLASEKTYQYRIHTGRVPEVFERKYVFSLNHTEQLYLENMKKASEYLVGTKDFTSFCGNSHMKKSAVRSVYEIRFEKLCGELRIIYRGNGFLQNMVRIMTGTLIEVGQGKKRADDIPEILTAKNRECAGFTAPPQGLMLMEVVYK